MTDFFHTHTLKILGMSQMDSHLSSTLYKIKCHRLHNVYTPLHRFNPLNVAGYVTGSP